MWSNTKSILFAVLITSMVLPLHSADVLGQGNNRPATGGGSSSKTKAQADEMLQQGETYKESNNSGRAKTSSQEEESAVSLQETLEWLKGKIAANGSYSYRGQQGVIRDAQGRLYNTEIKNLFKSTEFVSFSGCTVVFKTRLCNKDAQPSNGSGTSCALKIGLLYTVPLNSLDPSSIGIEKQTFDIDTWWITLHTTNDKPEIKMQLVDENPGPQKIYGENKFIITLNNEEVAKRMVRALQHAVKMCGGKAEPF